MTLLSYEFLLISLAAIVFVRATHGALRQLVFLGLSAWYVHRFLGPVGSGSTLAFCLVGFAAARVVRVRPRLTGICVLGLTAAFVYMQNYTFLGIVLPESARTRLLATAGLSFLFFKILHVVIDSASATVSRFSLSDYLCYCLNFTTFLMGPIQRFQDFDRQWSGREEPLADGFEPHLDALNRILRGLVKKYVLAEALAPYALLPGADVDGLGLGSGLLGTYAFYVFLYLDFSGYCDVVIGIGSLMGVRPPENFRFPFLSANVSEYWLRVHRSLTLWLTDYLFNPMLARFLRSSERPGEACWPVPTAAAITMVIAGLWHGTTGNFLLFGVIHAVYLAVYRLFERWLGRRIGRARLRGWRQKWWWRWPSVFLTLQLTSTAYLFFILEIKDLQTLWAS